MMADRSWRYKTKDLRRRLYKYRYLYLFLIPAIVWYAMFTYAPMFGLQIAFRDYKILQGFTGSKWVGFQWFRKMITDRTFFTVMRNTVVISLLKLVFVSPSGLVLALLLNEVRNGRYRTLVSSVSMLPHFFSWVVIASILMELLSPSTGAVNAILRLFGASPIYFLGNKSWFIFWIVISDMWESAGWNSIIFIAAIAGISPELYEAAALDGAGRWKQMIHVTIPGIAGTIVVVMVLKVGGVMNAGFDQIYNMYNTAVMDVADIIDTYVYRIGISNMKYSYSTAVGVFKNVINLSLVLLANGFSKKIGQNGLI